MRRRGRSPPRREQEGGVTRQEEDEEPEQYLDSDDQDALVSSLENEIIGQARQFDTYFRIVVVFAIIVSLIIYPFLICREECSMHVQSCAVHSVISSVIHGLCFYNTNDKITAMMATTVKRFGTSAAQSKEDNNNNIVWDYVWHVGMLLLVLLPIIMWLYNGFYESDIEHFHLGLIAGNVTIYCGALLIRWNNNSLSSELQELYKAKYDYKSL